MTREIIKRIMDIFVSSTVLVLLAIPLFIIAFLVFLDLRTNPVFIQYRNGKNQKRFPMIKFTTMKVKEDGIDNFSQAMPNDKRVTKFGSFLRKNSIDELLQFFNVFLGHMSLVGPRPHPISLDNEFESKIENYMNRYYVKPGITGLAQITGFRGETDTIEKMQGRVDADLKYIEKQSIYIDITILLKTFKVLFSGV
jgi:putative colanic acid biosynthesis UDP-glucose lipid carrier transferase